MSRYLGVNKYQILHRNYATARNNLVNLVAQERKRIDNVIQEFIINNKHARTFGANVENLLYSLARGFVNGGITIKTAFEATKASFLNNLSHIMDEDNQTDEEIWRDVAFLFTDLAATMLAGTGTALGGALADSRKAINGFLNNVLGTNFSTNTDYMYDETQGFIPIFNRAINEMRVMPLKDDPFGNITSQLNRNQFMPLQQFANTEQVTKDLLSSRWNTSDEVFNESVKLAWGDNDAYRAQVFQDFEEAVSKSLYWQEQVNKATKKDELEMKYGHTKSFQYVNAVGESMGRLIPVIIFSQLAGGTGIGSKVMAAAAQSYFAASVFGASIEEAQKSGASMEDMYSFAFGSMATEVLSEQLFGDGFRIGQKIVAPNLRRFVRALWTEAVEEMVAEVTTTGLSYFIEKDNKIDDLETPDDLNARIMFSALVGGMMGGTMSGGAFIGKALSGSKGTLQDMQMGIQELVKDKGSKGAQKFMEITMRKLQKQLNNTESPFYEQNKKRILGNPFAKQFFIEKTDTQGNKTYELTPLGQRVANGDIFAKQGNNVITKETHAIGGDNLLVELENEITFKDEQGKDVTVPIEIITKEQQQAHKDNAIMQMFLDAGYKVAFFQMKGQNVLKTKNTVNSFVGKDGNIYINVNSKKGIFNLMSHEIHDKVESLALKGLLTKKQSKAWEKFRNNYGSKKMLPIFEKLGIKFDELAYARLYQGRENFQALMQIERLSAFIQQAFNNKAILTQLMQQNYGIFSKIASIFTNPLSYSKVLKEMNINPQQNKGIVKIMNRLQKNFLEAVKISEPIIKARKDVLDGIFGAKLGDKLFSLESKYTDIEINMVEEFFLTPDGKIKLSEFIKPENLQKHIDKVMPAWAIGKHTYEFITQENNQKLFEQGYFLKYNGFYFNVKNFVFGEKEVIKDMWFHPVTNLFSFSVVAKEDVNKKKYFDNMAFTSSYSRVVLPDYIDENGVITKKPMTFECSINLPQMRYLHTHNTLPSQSFSMASFAGDRFKTQGYGGITFVLKNNVIEEKDFLLFPSDSWTDTRRFYLKDEGLMRGEFWFKTDENTSFTPKDKMKIFYRNVYQTRKHYMEAFLQDQYDTIFNDDYSRENYDFEELLKRLKVLKVYPQKKFTKESIKNEVNKTQELMDIPLLEIYQTAVEAFEKLAGQTVDLTVVFESLAFLEHRQEWAINPRFKNDVLNAVKKYRQQFVDINLFLDYASFDFMGLLPEGKIQLNPEHIDLIILNENYLNEKRGSTPEIEKTFYGIKWSSAYGDENMDVVRKTIQEFAAKHNIETVFLGSETEESSLFPDRKAQIFKDKYMNKPRAKEVMFSADTQSDTILNTNDVHEIAKKSNNKKQVMPARWQIEYDVTPPNEKTYIGIEKDIKILNFPNSSKNIVFTGSHLNNIRGYALVEYAGVLIPFYMSSGYAEKEGVTPKRWYPFLGMTADWINKSSVRTIRNYYFEPALRAIGEYLDDTFGDITERGALEISQNQSFHGEHDLLSKEEMDFLNQGLKPVKFEEDTSKNEAIFRSRLSEIRKHFEYTKGQGTDVDSQSEKELIERIKNTKVVDIKIPSYNKNGRPNNIFGRPLNKEELSFLDYVANSKKIDIKKITNHPYYSQLLDDIKSLESDFVVKYGVPAPDSTLIQDEGYLKIQREITRSEIEKGDKLSKEKKLMIVMGLPAAGKSSSLANFLQQGRNAYLADSDDIKKILNEKHNGTGLKNNIIHSESKLINQAIIKVLMKRGVNLVLPVVGDNVESVMKYARAAKAEGYSIELYNNSVEKEIALRRAMIRQVLEHRFMPIDIFGYSTGVTVDTDAIYEQIKGDEIFNGYYKQTNNVRFNEPPVFVESSGLLEGVRLIQTGIEQSPQYKKVDNSKSDGSNANVDRVGSDSSNERVGQQHSTKGIQKTTQVTKKPKVKTVEVVQKESQELPIQEQVKVEIVEVVPQESQELPIQEQAKVDVEVEQQLNQQDYVDPQERIEVEQTITPLTQSSFAQNTPQARVNPYVQATTQAQNALPSNYRIFERLFKRNFDKIKERMKKPKGVMDKLINEVYDAWKFYINGMRANRKFYNHMGSHVSKLIVNELHNLANLIQNDEARTDKTPTPQELQYIVNKVNEAIFETLFYVDNDVRVDINITQENPNGYAFTRAIYWYLRDMLKVQTWDKTTTDNFNKDGRGFAYRRLINAIMNLNKKNGKQELIQAVNHFNSVTNVEVITDLSLNEKAPRTIDTTKKQWDRDTQNQKNINDIIGYKPGVNSWIDMFTVGETVGQFNRKSWSMVLNEKLVRGLNRQLEIERKAAELFENKNWLKKNYYNIVALDKKKNGVIIQNLGGILVRKSQILALRNMLLREIARNRAIDLGLIEGNKTHHFDDGFDVDILHITQDKTAKRDKRAVGKVTTAIDLFNELENIIQQDAFMLEYNNKVVEFFNMMYPYINERFKEINGAVLQNDGLAFKDAFANGDRTVLNEIFVGLPPSVTQTTLENIYIPFLLDNSSYFKNDKLNFKGIVDLGVFDGMTEELTDSTGVINVDSITNILTAFTREVGNYYGLHRIMTDLNIMLNERLDGYEQTTYVGRNIREDVLKFYTDLLNDMAGYKAPAKNPKLNRSLSWFRRNFYRQALGANIKVIGSQITTLFNLSNLYGDHFYNMFPKMVKNLFLQNFGESKKRINDLRKGSNVYWNRTRTSTYEMGEATNEGLAGNNRFNRFTQKLMAGIRATDSAINRALYLTLLETKNPSTGQNYTRDEALAQVDMAILRSQSSPLALTKSSLLRTDNEVFKIFLRFLGEPMKLITQAYNSSMQLKYLRKLEKNKQQVMDSYEQVIQNEQNKYNQIKSDLATQESIENSDAFNALTKKEQKDIHNEAKRLKKELEAQGEVVSEAIQNRDQVQKQVDEALDNKEEAKSLAFRRYSAFVVAIIYLTVLQTAFDLLRSKGGIEDKPEEEDYLEYMMKLFGENFLGSVFGMFPFARDAYQSIATGFNIDDIDEIAPLNDIGRTVNYMINAIVSGAEMNLPRTLKNLSFATGRLFGVPMLQLERLFTTPMLYIDESIHYRYSDYFGKETKENIELKRAIAEGNDKMVATIIESKINNRNILVSNDVVDELIRLSKTGYEVKMSGVNDSYTVDGVKYVLTREQKRKFAEIYNKADLIIQKIMRTSRYRKLNDDMKQSLLLAIYNYYYRMAKQEVLDVELIPEANYYKSLTQAYKYFITKAEVFYKTQNSDKYKEEQREKKKKTA